MSGVAGDWTSSSSAEAMDDPFGSETTGVLNGLDTVDAPVPELGARIVVEGAVMGSETG